MSRKRPRSKDPHSWIKDTTKKSGEPETTAPAEEPATSEAGDEAPAGVEEETAAPEGAPRRVIIVEYDKKDGRIVAAHEVFHEARESAAAALASAPEGHAVTHITLTGKMLDKSLLDIHDNYKVAVSKTKPTLSPKR